VKIIRLSGTVGADFSGASLAVELHDAAGDDLDIQVASPGGSVFDGLEIFNAIRDYRRQNPSAQIVITLKGLAASMASYIASVEVANRVRAEDNAVFMLHNPWSIASGDHREMQKSSDFLKGLADLLATAYVKRSRKSRAEITKMMDAETWLFGDEIKAAGFADEIIQGSDDNGKPSASTKDKSAAIGAARVEFAKMQKLIRDTETPADIDKAAALVRSSLAAFPPSSSTCRSEAQSSARLEELILRDETRKAAAKLDAAEAAPKPEPWRPGVFAEHRYNRNNPIDRVHVVLEQAAREQDEEQDRKERLEKFRASLPPVAEMERLSYRLPRFGEQN